MANTIPILEQVAHWPDGTFSASTLLDQHAFSDVNSYTWIEEVVGTLTDVPIVQPTQALTGHAIPSFVDDFYGRIHIQPVSVPLGFIGSPILRSIEVWNGDLNANDTLNSLIKLDVDDSIVITEPAPTPLVYLPLQSRTYTLSVSSQGPAESDVTYTFDFVSIDINVNITGNRIILFAFVPEQEVDQDLQWLTTVQRAFDNTETTQQIRDIPRESITYNFRQDNRTAISNNIMGGHAASIGIPKWIQSTPTTAAIALNGTQIFCDISKIDIAPDDTIFISNNDDFLFTRLLTIEVDHFTIDPSTVAFPVGSLVMRTMITRVSPEATFNLFLTNAADFKIKFDSTDYVDLVPADLPLQFNGYDVLEDANIAPSSKGQFTSNVNTDLVDYVAGRFTYLQRTSNPRLKFRATKFLVGLDDIRDYQKWLFKMAGRNGRFWVMGYSADIQPLGTILIADTNIPIVNIKLKAVFDLYPDTFYLYLRLKDGTVLIREVSNVIETSSTVETLIMAVSYGQQIEPSDIDIFDRLNFVRMVSDVVRFKYDRPAQCTVDFDVVETR